MKRCVYLQIGVYYAIHWVFFFLLIFVRRGNDFCPLKALHICFTSRKDVLSIIMKASCSALCGLAADHQTLSSENNHFVATNYKLSLIVKSFTILSLLILYECDFSYSRKSLFVQSIGKQVCRSSVKTRISLMAWAMICGYRTSRIQIFLSFFTGLSKINHVK